MKISTINPLLKKSAISAAVFSTSVMATAAAETAADNQIILDEIVVTAEKRAQSLQDVPVSISAVSGDMIEQFSIDDVQGINAITPGMAFSRAGGEPQIYIRGIGTSALGVTVDSSVAVHADGVYLARAQMGLTQFLDVDRVEVLRGPQGTLYGRNATGGAINILHKKPGDEWDSNVLLGVGSFNRTEVSAATGGPLGDAVGIRLAGKISQDDGFTDDLDSAGGDKIDDNDLTALRGIMSFDISDSVSLELIAEWSDFESGNRTIRPLDDLGAAQAMGALPLPSFDETRNNLPTYYDWETSAFTATLEIALSDAVTLTSITAYRDYENDFLFNTDGTEVEVTRTYFRYDTDQLSQELRLASTDSSRLQWLVGAYYLEEDKNGALGLARTTHPLSPLSFIIANEDESTAYALFGEAAYALTDSLTVKAGIRYSSEEKDDITNVGAVFDLEGLNSDAEVSPFGAPRVDSQDWSATTPRLVLEYKTAADNLWYFSVSEGFKSGGWNAFDRNPAFDPEEILSYEFGVKSQFNDDRVRLNAAAFYYDYDDLQVNTFIDGLATTTNAASATVMGFEVELTAALTTALTLNAGYAYLDSEYEEFCSPFGVWAATDTPVANDCDAAPVVGATRNVDLSGNTLVNAPEHKLSVGLQYEAPLAGGSAIGLFVRATYQDQVFFSQFNEDIVGEDSYTLLDVRAAWTSANERMEVSVYGKNLGDEEYNQNVVRFTSTSDPVRDVNAIGNALGYPAAGLTWGAQVKFNF